MNGDRVVNSTVQISYGGEPVGSGFRFVNEDTVVTSAHNLFPTDEDIPIRAITEPGTEIGLSLVDVSPEPRAGGHDFAILQADEGFQGQSEVLQPDSVDPSPGDEVVFAGHPYDISDTLLHTATVSGPHPYGFYLDGSVNLGNSGGPIVSRESGDVVGIVTESRIYRDKDLDELIDHFTGVQQQLLRIQEVHDTTINMVEVENLAIDVIQELQEALDILSENISSGIGVGYHIQHVLDGLDGLDLM